jgi:hypothetical protein
MFTVHFDDGRKPVFEKFDTHDEAEARVVEVGDTLGRIAIILEDYDS